MKRELGEEDKNVGEKDKNVSYAYCIALSD